MSVSVKVRSAIERSSWIRRMFEEGAALIAEYGTENVYDFTLGNPSIEPPAAFQREITSACRATGYGHASIYE